MKALKSTNINWLFVAVILWLQAPALASQNTSPNFILVLTDDQGWSSMSSPMDKDAEESQSDFHYTPSLDLISASGVRFSNAYAAAPVCSPTRYSIQFGKSPARLRHTRVRGPNWVNHDQLAIPQLLKLANPNYRSAHFGKWHIDAEPAQLGYDVSDGKTGNKEGGYVEDQKEQWRGYEKDDPKRIEAITERAVDFIKDSLRREQPFFVQVSHYALHSNLEYSGRSFRYFEEKKPGDLHSNIAYASMLLDMDTAIGTLFETYRELGLENNTYFLVTSDNGGMPVLPQKLNQGRPYEKGMNYPLLRGKWDLMEGGIRVPFMVVGPSISANSQSSEPVISYDLLPTFADLTGATEHLSHDTDGVSLRPLLTTPNDQLERPQHGLVFHFPHYNAVGLNEPHSAIRVNSLKLVRFHTSARSLLFDLATDPYERIDIAGNNPECSQALERLLNDYLQKVNAETPEESVSWEKPGKNGAVHTKFLSRYPENNGVTKILKCEHFASRKTVGTPWSHEAQSPTPGVTL